MTIKAGDKIRITEAKDSMYRKYSYGGRMCQGSTGIVKEVVKNGDMLVEGDKGCCLWISKDFYVPFKEPHPHKTLILLWADDPTLEFEIEVFGDWVACIGSPLWQASNQYRLKVAEVEYLKTTKECLATLKELEDLEAKAEELLKEIKRLKEVG